MEIKISKDYCPYCCQKTNHKSLFRETKSSNWEDGFHWSEVFELIICNGCDNIQYRTTYSDESMLKYEEGDDGYEHQVQYDVMKYYPRSLRGHLFLSNLYEVPSKVRIVFLETVESMKNNCYLLSGVGLRAIIESICIDQNISGRNLEQKINNLSKNKLITEKDANRLHSIRFLGNDSVHEMEVPKENKLIIALKIIETLLNSLYLIDIEANLHLDTIITDYETFKNLLLRKFIPIAQNEEKSIKQVLGKDFRRIEPNYILNFTQKVIDEINSGDIGLISIGRLKSSTLEGTALQHFIKNPSITLNLG